MARPPIDPNNKKKLFNCYLSNEARKKLKEICWRQSVREMKHVSEGAFVEEVILGTRLPPPPKPEAIKAYDELTGRSKP